MENTLNNFKSWVFNAAKNKNISISQLTWPKRFNLSINDYLVQTRFNEKDYFGHGSDIDPDIAILKATAEAYERFCVTSLNLKNSNGCAVHTDQLKAEENAYCELVERDAFLVKFINGEKFNQIDERAFQPSLYESCNLSNYCIAHEGLIVTLTRITINNSANIFGLGTGKSFVESLAKSEMEALRQWVFAMDKALVSKANYEEISKKQNLSFDDHGDIALTPEHYNEIKWLFGEASSSRYKKFLYFKSEKTSFIKHDVITSSDNPFHGIPLFFVKASNPEAQELFTGRTVDNLNPLRIPNNGKLNLCLHPFR